MKKQLSISILNLKNDNEEIFFKNIKNFNDIKIEKNFEISLHFDIMDREFVPNNGISFEKLKLAKKYNMFADVHLMVKRPLEDGYIKKAILNGADRITIHYEIENLKDTIDYLKKQKVKIGLAIKPSTSINSINEYVNDIDTLLIMSVEPGFGGQKYIKDTDKKIKLARSKYKNINIQIDGGINFESVKGAFESNISSVVVGSYLTCDILNIYSKIIAFNIEYEIFSNTSKRDLRQIANKWYKVIDFYILELFVKSNISEFKSFAFFCIQNMCVNSKNKGLNEAINDFVNENAKYIKDEPLFKITKDILKK